MKDNGFWEMIANYQKFKWTIIGIIVVIVVFSAIVKSVLN